jgi:hypothetical protein
VKEKLYPFMFEDTGIKVNIRKVSPMLVVELQKAFPPPAPPRQRVRIGESDEYSEEPNPAHPDYLIALGQYNQELEQRVRKLLIQRGVVIPPELDGWKDEVKELREWWLEAYGKELEGDDKTIYISYIAVGTDSDLADLLAVIMQRSQPTEEAINIAKDTFPGEVPGT